MINEAIKEITRNFSYDFGAIFSDALISLTLFFVPFFKHKKKLCTEVGLQRKLDKAMK